MGFPPPNYSNPNDTLLVLDDEGNGYVFTQDGFHPYNPNGGGDGDNPGGPGDESDEPVSENLFVELKSIDVNSDNKINIATFIDETPAYAFFGTTQTPNNIEIIIKPCFLPVEGTSFSEIYGKIKIYLEKDELFFESDIKEISSDDNYCVEDGWIMELSGMPAVYPNFKIEFYISLNMQNWEKITESYNARMYVTFQEIQSPTYYDERLIYFGSKAAQGSNNEDKGMKADFIDFAAIHQNNFYVSLSPIQIGYAHIIRKASLREKTTPIRHAIGGPRDETSMISPLTHTRMTKIWMFHLTNKKQI